MHLGLWGAPGAVILQERDRPGPGERHRDGPMAERPARRPWRGEGSPPMRVSVVDEAEPIEQRHHPLVGVEAGRGEAGRLAEVAHEVAVGLFHVGLAGRRSGSSWKRRLQTT